MVSRIKKQSAVKIDEVAVQKQLYIAYVAEDSGEKAEGRSRKWKQR
jgi:hypothetical protein